MGTKVGVGRSRNRSSSAAAAEAMREASIALEGRPADLVLVFATAGHAQDELLDGVRAMAPRAKIAGCSGEGIITRGESEEVSHAIAVMALASDQIEADVFFAPSYVEDAEGAAEVLARAIEHSRVKGKLLVLFPDGVGGNCRALIERLEARLPQRLPIVGGTAGDLLAFERTFQYHDGGVSSGGVTAVLFGGDVTPEFVVTHGCDLVGRERTITRARGEWVEAIDGEAAWSFFKPYLPEGVDGLDAMHVSHLLLGERLPSADALGGFTVRVPIRLDRSRGALYFAAGLREGTRVQLGLRNSEKVVHYAVAAAERLAATHPGRAPAFVLQLDCVGRGTILFGPETAERLIVPVQSVFPEGVPWIGFHTYGEIAPVSGRTWFHNYTAVYCAFFVEPEVT
jgi:hypothetical protein